MFYHSHGFDPVAAGNSTKAFPRDLAPWEVKQARLGNAANFGKRAGGRAVNTEARQKKYQKLLDSINKGQKKQAAQGGGDARQRRLGDEDAGSQDFNAGREKRGRRGQEADAGFVSWDEQYTDQHGSSIFEDGQNGYALQGHLHHHEEHANFQASTSPQEHSNAYGAPKAPFQYPNLQSQPLPGQSQSNFSRNYPSIGTPFTPVENNLQQAPYSGVPMQPGRSIYEEEENRLRVQELDNKGPIHRALPTGPRQKRMKTPATQMLLNNGVTIQDNNPTGQYPQSYTGTERSRNVGAGEPFQTLRAETHYEPAKYDHHNMIQNGPIMNNGLLYPPHGQAGSNHYVLPVQHQQSFEGAGHAPKPRCNTIGPGGRNVHQAPEQILGRRGREETGEDENRETGAYPLGDSVSDVQANPDLDERSLHKHKRQRNNALPGTEPRPQRRHQKERTPRTRYYGAGGAPAPLLPPEEFFATTESGSDFDGDMEGLLRSSQKVFGKLQSGSDSNDDIPFDFDDDAGGQVWENYAPNGGTQDTEQDTYQPFGRDQVVDGSAYTSDQPRNTAYDEVYEGQDVTAASNQNVIQAMGGAPTRHSEYSQHRSGVNLPQQVLGKHGREDRLGEGQQGTYVPEQSREDQGPGEQDGRGEEDADEPKLKRRRMPASEGYHSPPAQAPKAAMVQKARKAERDVHLAPPQFNIQEPMAEISEAPQVEEADLTPSQIIIGGSVINLNEFAEAEDTDVPRTQPNVEEDVPETDGAPLVADAQGPDPPRAPAPARTEREVRTDIRDVRPENAWQSQSLNNALRYTREAFFEWTGEEAPATNLEGSYNVQYRVLRAVFKAWWKSEKNPQRSEPLPELYRMKAWSGEVEDWKAPENVEHLFDPMRRGRWAARNEDGSLKKPQFRWNVEDYSWYDAKDEEQL